MLSSGVAGDGGMESETLEGGEGSILKAEMSRSDGVPGREQRDPRPGRWCEAG